MVSTVDIIREASKGKNQSEIARTLGVSSQAISKRFKKMIDNDKVGIYDNHLPEVLKTSAITLITDSLQPAKLKKTSTLQGFTSAGICMTKLEGKLDTSINITITNQVLQQAQADQISLKQAILQITGKDPDQLMQDITLPLPVVSNTILDGSIISDNPVLCSDNRDMPK